MLAVLVMLTGVLAPSMGDFINDAKNTSAKANLETLCAAVGTLLKDTGETFLLRDGHPGTDGLVRRDVSNRVKLLVGAGPAPSTRSKDHQQDKDIDWDAPVENDAVQTFSDQLIANEPGGRRELAYRTGAPYGWRGAYLGTEPNADPWGHRYAANVEFLGSPSGNTSDLKTGSVVVLSAGPNGRAEMPFHSFGAEHRGDDLFCVISGTK